MNHTQGLRSILIRLKVRPMPKQSARFASRRVGGKTRIISYQPKEVKQYEKNILIEAMSQFRSDFKPLSGCLMVEIEYSYKYPKSMDKGFKDHIKGGGRILKTTRPDVTDNLNKPVMDALQGRFYKEDCIISVLKSYKVYGMRDGIKMKISEIDIFMS